MKVNSCHIPPRSLTLRSRVVSFLLAALTLHFRHFVRTVHSRAEGEARGRGGQGTGVSKEKEMKRITLEIQSHLVTSHYFHVTILFSE